MNSTCRTRHACNVKAGILALALMLKATFALGNAVPVGEPMPITTRDGVTLEAQSFGQPGHTTVVLIHGVTGNARNLTPMARMLTKDAAVQVLALSMRGHGQSGGAPGDIHHIGQYEEDVADVVSALRDRGARSVVLAGFSMGGGIVLRYAERKSLPVVDGYILFAPIMGPDSKTTRREEGENRAMQAFVQFRTGRAVTLSILNAVGIKAFNKTRIMFFNIPGDGPKSYSYRALTGVTPRKAQAALQADSLPLLTVVGSDDATFHVDEFPKVIGQHTNSQVEIVDQLNHMTLMLNPRTAKIASEWLQRLKPSTL